VLGIDADLVIPDKRLRKSEGAVAPWKGEAIEPVERELVRAVPADFPVHTPVADLTKEHDVLWKAIIMQTGINDFFKEVEQNCTRCTRLSRYRGRTVCPSASYRLRKEACI